MDQITVLIIVAAIAWFCQIALGWFQIKMFNEALSALSVNGQICIGRSTGRFSPRVIVALSLDDQGFISDNFIMKGMTVFARPIRNAQLQGIELQNVDPETFFPKNKSIQQALTLAKNHKK